MAQNITDELIKRTRGFCTSCINAIAPQFLKIKDSLSGDSFAESVGFLMSSLDLTTDDIVFLLEHNRYWDVPILFRSILDGTSQCLYLLSAPCKEEETQRLNEYRNILPRKEWASLEQPVVQIKKTSLCQDNKNLEGALVDALHEKIQQEKTGEGESARVKAVVAKWRFKELSKVLRRECPQWAASADMWEYRYAISNFMVHKSGLGCKHLIEEVREIRTHYDSSSVAYAMPLLISSAVLLFDRLFIFSERFKLDSRPLLNVMEQNISFFTNAASAEDVAREVVARQFEEANSGVTEKSISDKKGEHRDVRKH
ncbi:MAG: hypothetical protein IJL17_06145 [Kiritimatiellae bacterium]|nr:hypothetical protein [Kiritimatiellia bacterium]